MAEATRASAWAVGGGHQPARGDHAAEEHEAEEVDTRLGVLAQLRADVVPRRLVDVGV
jgi:hypothetical protein